MQLGMIGLGRMGANMTLRLMRGGHDVVAYDRNPESVSAVAKEGAEPALSLEEVLAKLTPPRHVWMMVPSGAAVTATIEALAPILSPGDAIIDGGNSNYRDSIKRADELRLTQLHFVDCGTSGGIWGLENGYCLMIGGEREIFERMEPIFATLAPADGYAHVGASGAGHFVKMVHNGIEYALLQSYAEGFEILKASEFELDLHEIAGIWRYGSVVRSWLLELLYSAFEQEGNELEGIAGYVEDSGEGRWTIFEAINESVPAPVIASSLFARFASRQDESFGAKINAALRKQFGGHAVKTE